MRAQGTIATPGGVRLHDHVAWCGDGPADLGSLAIDTFISAESDARLVLLADDPGPDTLVALPGRDRMLANGKLIVDDGRDVYREVLEGGPDFDPRAQLTNFDAMVDDALDAGYSGLRVVAENTSLLLGDDATVERWLAWEQLTDQWQARRPVGGVCFFDRTRIPAARLAAVSSLHPLGNSIPAPRFQVFHDDDAVRLTGSLERSDVPLLRGVLAVAGSAAGDDAVLLDLADVTYAHHAVLHLISQFDRIAVRHAPPIVTRLSEAGRIQLSLVG